MEDQQNALQSFIANHCTLSTAKPDTEKLQELVTDRKPFLIAIPQNTKWFGIHGLYTTAHSTTATIATPYENDVGFEVIYNGDMYSFMSGLAPGNTLILTIEWPSRQEGLLFFQGCKRCWEE